MKFFRNASLILAVVLTTAIGYGSTEGKTSDNQKSETDCLAIDEPEKGSASLSPAIESNPALNESVEGLEAVVHPNGMKSLSLEERFTNYVALTVSPDGEMTTVCTTDLAAVLATIEAARLRETRGE